MIENKKTEARFEKIRLNRQNWCQTRVSNVLTSSPDKCTKENENYYVVNEQPQKKHPFLYSIQTEPSSTLEKSRRDKFVLSPQPQIQSYLEETVVGDCDRYKSCSSPKKYENEVTTKSNFNATKQQQFRFATKINQFNALQNLFPFKLRDNCRQQRSQCQKQPHTQKMTTTRTTQQTQQQAQSPTSPINCYAREVNLGQVTIPSIKIDHQQQQWQEAMRSQIRTQQQVLRSKQEIANKFTHYNKQNQSPKQKQFLKTMFHQPQIMEKQEFIQSKLNEMFRRLNERSLDNQRQSNQVFDMNEDRLQLSIINKQKHLETQPKSKNNQTFNLRKYSFGESYYFNNNLRVNTRKLSYQTNKSYFDNIAKKDQLVDVNSNTQIPQSLQY